MRQTKRIILAGHAASGKDYLAEHFVKEGYRKDVSLTTRPIRDGEVPGETYHYVSKDEFISAVANNKFYEHVEFNGWMYGTLMDDWMNADVFIMTPSGIETIKPEDRKDCIIVYIEIPEEVRRQRMDFRSDSDTTERRLKADRMDFAGFIDYDYRINDPNFNPSTWIDLLVKAADSEASIEELTNTQG
jgi:guanylate kinase